MAYKKEFILQDWDANKGNSKGRLITVLFRLAQLRECNIITKIILFPYLILYKLGVEWIMGIELPIKSKIGSGLVIFHGQSLVIHSNVIMGANCTLRHCTTIGSKIDRTSGKEMCPTIGNNVNIGANACIIGGLTVGDNVHIGAGSVVVKSIPSNCTIAGNPAHIISTVSVIS